MFLVPGLHVALGCPSTHFAKDEPEFLTLLPQDSPPWSTGL